MEKKLKVLYTNGDSVSWGSELKDRTNRFSTLIAKEKGLVDFNVASSGISNDRIFRNTMRDVCKFLNGEPIYNEELGYVKVDEMFVLLSFTAPTRFDYFDGEVFIREHLWSDKDKWGRTDANKQNDNKYVINHSHLAPSFVRIFQQIISLTSFLKSNNIPYLCINAFFEYNIDEIADVNKNINVDKVSNQFDDTADYFGLLDLYKHIPQSFKDINLTTHLKGFNDVDMFEERGHPSPKGHKEIAELLKNKI
jgi:hypothetical protein